MSVITNEYPVHVQLGSNDDGCRPSPAQILVKVAILLLDRRDRSLTLKPRQIPPVWLKQNSPFPNGAGSKPADGGADLTSRVSPAFESLRVASSASLNHSKHTACRLADCAGGSRPCVATMCGEAMRVYGDCRDTALANGHVSSVHCTLLSNSHHCLVILQSSA